MCGGLRYCGEICGAAGQGSIKVLFIGIPWWVGWVSLHFARRMKELDSLVAGEHARVSVKNMR